VSPLAPPFLSFSRQRLVLVVLVLLCFVPALTAIGEEHTPPSSLPNLRQEKYPSIRLDPGKPIEKRLGGGETDSYEIQASAGQFLHAVVEQLGIDVALALYGPNGKQIATMDSPNGTLGPEQISTIAESTGLYRLDVASNDKVAPAARYRVSVEPLREPTDADRARISAERSFNSATQLLGVGGRDSLLHAAREYEATAPSWHAAGDAYEESLAWYSSGLILAMLNENREALDCYNHAFELRRAMGDRGGEAVVLNGIGEVYKALGEKQEAIDRFSQALQLLRTAGDRQGEAVALNDIGAVYADLRENQKALEYLGRALALRRVLSDRQGEAVTLGNIAGVYVGLGENQKALDYFNQVLPLFHSLGDGLREGGTLNNIGFIYAALGEKGKALYYFGLALSLRQAAGDSDGEAATRNSIGAVHDDLGEKQEALDYYAQAQALYRAAGDRSGEAITLNNIGYVYDNLGENQKAFEYFNEALPLWRAVGDRDGEATTLNDIGAAYIHHGENQKAFEYFNEALPLWRAVGDRDGEATTLNNIGRVYYALGDKDAALKNYSRALALAQELQSPLREAAVLNNLVTFWRSVGETEIAVFLGKQAVGRYQQVRRNIQTLEKETQRSFLKSKEKTYRDLADLLITQGRLPEAQQVLDLLKDEEYFEFIRRDDNDAASLTAPVTLTRNEEALNREYEENASHVTAIGNEWAALHSKPSRTSEEEKHLAELTEQLKSANEAWEKFLDGLYAELGRSREAQTTIENVKESASGMQRVVRELGPGAVVLYTLVGEEKYHVIVVTPTVMVAREYSIKAEELRKKVFEFRQALLDPKSDPVPKAQELYRILVGPAAQDLTGANAETLMWSLDDVLRYIPFAALHDGHGYLVEKYRNEVFTPASVASLTERSNVKGWRCLGMGVSKSYGDFSALPSVPEELRRIIRDKNNPDSSGVLSGQMMLDDTFTEVAMKKALEQNFPIVHIASHYSFAPGNETNSFLLLGGKDAQGGHLSLAEIRTDPGFSFADTELLTLSACNTAVSSAAGDGREVDGLGILAQQKGARAVVASLWGVYDPSTGILMQEFYRLWTRESDMPKAEALREAQLELLRGAFAETGEAMGGDQSRRLIYAHPFYWAPFILIGNWR
jgi:CHAT domain-containing protein/tetratricopeptide (TPR) repeat protein